MEVKKFKSRHIIGAYSPSPPSLAQREGRAGAVARSRSAAQHERHDAMLWL